MQLFLTLIICLLATLSAGGKGTYLCLCSNTLLLTPPPDKKPAYDVETFKYHGYGLVEAWIGRDAINIGDMFGSQLYDTMFKGLAKHCSSEDWHTCGVGNWLWVDTRYVKNMETGELGWGE